MRQDQNVTSTITYMMNQYGLVSKSYNQINITAYHMIKVCELVFKKYQIQSRMIKRLFIKPILK